ncbi:Prenyltransferase family protein [Hibiscus syriacus]|uniref:Prenyltransferase family protein n=1 Tax=Hibiscus syriacus TaxID=106335 RepID=A0A6A3BLY6_HIBSY|nr:Prenyltransferase family protein [Hibiscus syriacus]
MKGSNKATVLTLAEKCKNILAPNWQGHLNTIKTDAHGSKENIYTSKVKYIVKKGKPFIWVPEHDLHNVNTLIDERGSFSVASPFPGPLGKLLKSMNKFPVRVALTGDVVPLTDKKDYATATKHTLGNAIVYACILLEGKIGLTIVCRNLHVKYSLYVKTRETAYAGQILLPVQAQSVAEFHNEVMLAEEKAVKEFSYTVSGVLSSSNHFSTSRSENLKELIDGENCHHMNHSSNGAWFGFFAESGKGDIIPYHEKKDAYILSLDRKGFDVLGKVLSKASVDEEAEYQWKQFRIPFKEEARDVESFCQQLMLMEEEAIKMVSSYSGLG